MEKEVVDNIFNLIKLEETILNKYRETNYESLEYLIELEKEFINNINYNYLDEITYILNNHLDIILEMPTKLNKELIVHRFETMIPELDNKKTKSSAYTTILQAHHLQTLIKYNDLICDLETEKIYNEEFYADYNLTSDYLISRGNKDMLFELNISLQALASNLNELNYAYAKDELLTELGNQIIEDLNDINTFVHNQRREYKILELENIKNSICHEHIIELEGKLASKTLTKTP